MNKIAKLFASIAFVFAFGFMAVGYAAVQDTLLVNGTVSVESQNKLYAVYDSTLHSLTFYNGATPETAADQTVYDVSENGYTADALPPWISDANAIYEVKVETEAPFNAPKSTAYWFYNMNVCATVDLTGMNFSEVEIFEFMFSGCSALTTIFVDEGFVCKADAVTENMFGENTLLVGGKGTPFDATKTDSEYARIDLPGQAGYFTYGGYMLIFANTYEGEGYVPFYELSRSSTITIPETKPTFGNAKFLGWKTADAATLYQPNTAFTFDSESTSKTQRLYAIFDQVTNLESQKLVDATGENYTITGEYNKQIEITESDATDGRKEVTIKDTSTSYHGLQNIIVDGADVIIEDFAVDDFDDNDGNSSYMAVYVKNGGTVTIKGGSYSKSSIVGGDSGKNSKVIIEGGVFSGYSVFNGMELMGIFTQFVLDNVIIKGGSFETDLTESGYIADGYKAVYNEETGFYDVVKDGVECETHSFDAFINNGDGTHSQACSVCNTVVSEDHDFTAGDCICGAPCPHTEFNGDTCSACGYDNSIEPVEMPVLGEDNAFNDELFVDFNDDPSYEITVTSDSDKEGISFKKTDDQDNYYTTILGAWIELDDLEMAFVGITEIGGNSISLKHWLNIGASEDSKYLAVHEAHRIILDGYEAGALTVEAKLATETYVAGEPVVVVLSYIDGAYDGETPVELTHIALRATVIEGGKIRFEVPEEQAQLMLSITNSEGFMMLSVVSENKDV